MTENDEARLKKYLLDDLPRKEREETEERYLLDEEYHEALLAMESELASDWVAGALPAVQARRFAARVARDPILRRRVYVMEALAGAGPTAMVDRAPPSVPAWAALIAAGLSIVSIGSVAFFQMQNTRRLDQVQARLVNATEPAARAAMISDPTFAPPPGLQMANTARLPLLVPASAGLVHLQIVLPVSAMPLRIALRRMGAAEVWSTLENSSGKTDIAVPAKLLSAGDYMLSASASDNELDSWIFRIAR